MRINEYQVVKTDNTYEATYYIMFGAKLVEIETRPVPQHKRKKLTYSTYYILTFERVPNKCVELWKNDEVQVHLKSFMYARIRLKKKIKKVLEKRN